MKTGSGAAGPRVPRAFASGGRDARGPKSAIVLARMGPLNGPSERRGPNGSARMARDGRSRAMQLSAIAVVLAGLTGYASAQDLKTWRHGIIEAKSDAGILYMASKRDSPASWASSSNSFSSR